MTVHRHIQKCQFSKSSECAISNRCDLVVAQDPVRKLVNVPSDVATNRNIQSSQAAKSSKYLASDRCDPVGRQVPEQAACKTKLVM
jgi:hypothetical protein